MAGKGGIGEFLNGIASGDSFQASPGSLLGGIQAATQQKRAKDVLAQLMGSQAPETITWNQPQRPDGGGMPTTPLPGNVGGMPVETLPQYEQGMKSLLTRLKPERALEAYQDKFLPKAPTTDDYLTTDQGIYDIRAGNLMPGTGKIEGAQSPLGKAKRDLQAGLIDQATYDAIARKENYIAPDRGGIPWRVMSKEEAVRAGLPEGGTYKTNGIDFSVVVQPKQEKPTAGENTAAYHGRRLATALGTLSEVLSKNPGAATTLVPGDNWASKGMRGPDENRVQAALPEIGDALLTLGTGAAYTQTQFDQQWKANLPALNDSDQVLADKFGRVQALYEQAKTNAGPQGIDLPDISSLAAIYKNRAGAQKPATAAPPPANERVVGKSYPGANGPVTWTGTGWIPAKK